MDNSREVVLDQLRDGKITIRVAAQRLNVEYYEMLEIAAGAGIDVTHES